MLRERNGGLVVSYMVHSVLEEFVMGEVTDKIRGTANEAIGKAKQAIGKATDNGTLQGKGIAQEAKGDLQKAKGAVKHKINRM